MMAKNLAEKESGNFWKIWEGFESKRRAIRMNRPPQVIFADESARYIMDYGFRNFTKSRATMLIIFITPVAEPSVRYGESRVKV